MEPSSSMKARARNEGIFNWGSLRNNITPPYGAPRDSSAAVRLGTRRSTLHSGTVSSVDSLEQETKYCLLTTLADKQRCEESEKKAKARTRHVRDSIPVTNTELAVSVRPRAVLQAAWKKSETGRRVPKQQGGGVPRRMVPPAIPSRARPGPHKAATHPRPDRATADL